MCVTYRDGGVERFPVQTQILLSDIQHVHLRARHHDPDQSPIFGTGTLKNTHMSVLTVEINMTYSKNTT